jgi:hypothetical protein
MNQTLAWSRSILNTTAARWLALAEFYPRELLSLRPLPAEWSAIECLIHIVDTERSVFSVRLRIFLEGKDSFPAFDPNKDGTKLDATIAPVELAREFGRLRAENLTLIDQITPDMLPRQARHAQLGMVTLEQMLNELAAHDLDHTMQAERAVMQTFIQGCGPWQSYFVANTMK